MIFYINIDIPYWYYSHIYYIYNIYVCVFIKSICIHKLYCLSHGSWRRTCSNHSAKPALLLTRVPQIHVVSTCHQGNFSLYQIETIAEKYNWSKQNCGVLSKGNIYKTFLRGRAHCTREGRKIVRGERLESFFFYIILCLLWVSETSTKCQTNMIA